ncbi:cyclodeaminase/cyclohydrolase family protein [Burkholderia cepacia]|uniref:cyclodeaminase/cyclohydrolase family protein n=1 Tax=Burkholderia cepacia TaxID=292 RepID=UPI001CF3ADC8|nr:cyclodeaminase/cyclohydrolase family protein [Burkholderia cepacia]MCA8115568.1 cyclodeaminase/cyclohydrolase family protein [Burkholderia cepacia]MCA8402655.1 cyclodeaminase/cyclohydrolase family protein [Burkholderia cepacia]
MENQASQSTLTGLLERPTTQLLDDFGAGNASPGSGSAAALMGLLACKLIVTVCRKSAEKPVCQKHWPALEYIQDQIQTQFEPTLRTLFEKDAREFDQVVALRRARDQAETAHDKSAYSRESNSLLEEATENAFKIADICMRLIDHGITVFENGWPSVRGDSGAAISVAVSGVMSGIFIANLNIKSLKGRRYATANVGRCAELHAELGKKQTRAFGCILSLNAEALAAVQLDLIATEDAVDASDSPPGDGSA